MHASSHTQPHVDAAPQDYVTINWVIWVVILSINNHHLGRRLWKTWKCHKTFVVVAFWPLRGVRRKFLPWENWAKSSVWSKFARKKIHSVSVAAQGLILCASEKWKIVYIVCFSRNAQYRNNKKDKRKKKWKIKALHKSDENKITYQPVNYLVIFSWIYHLKINRTVKNIPFVLFKEEFWWKLQRHTNTRL